MFFRGQTEVGWDRLMVIISQQSSKSTFGANKRICQILLCGIGLKEGYPPSQTGISNRALISSEKEIVFLNHRQLIFLLKKEGSGLGGIFLPPLFRPLPQWRSFTFWIPDVQLQLIKQRRKWLARYLVCMGRPGGNWLRGLMSALFITWIVNRMGRTCSLSWPNANPKHLVQLWHHLGE